MALVTHDDAYPKPSVAWATVLLLLLAYGVALLDRQILSLMVQPIRRDLDISDTELSVLAGFAFVLFYSTVGLVMGRFADRHNRRNLIIGGIVLWCLATAGCGLAENYEELFVGRMLVGFGEAALGPAAYSMIADLFQPDRRAKATGVYTMGVFMGTGAALIFGGAAVAATGSAELVDFPLVGQLRPWQAAFIIVSLPGFLLAALLLLIREPTRKDVAGVRPTLPELKEFLSANMKPLLLILTAFGMNGLINYGLVTWVPTVFVRKFGWTPPEIGMVYGALLMICGAAGVYAGGWYVSLIRPRGTRPDVLSVARNALLVSVPFLILLGFAPNPAVGLVCAGALAFTIGIPAGLAPVALYEITPNAFRGQVIAFYLLAATLFGLGVGVTLIAAVSDFVFRDETAIGKALAVVLVAAAAVGVACLQLAGVTRSESAEPSA